jgi:presenilin-like A22 family membrane protease
MSESAHGSAENEVKSYPPTVYVGAALAVITTFFIVQAFALSLVEPGAIDQMLTDMSGESTNVEGQSSISLSLVAIAGAVFMATIMILLFRYGLDRLILGFMMYGAAGVGTLTVLLSVGYSQVSLAVGIIFGLTLAGALWKYPRWYVLNTIAVLWAAVGVAYFGMLATPLLVVAVLVLLLLYDIATVYLTGHMEELASEASGMKLPVMVIFPLTFPFTLDGYLAGDDDALAIGTGDLVVPSVLVASAVAFSPAQTYSVAGISLNIPGLGAALGTAVGVMALILLSQVWRRGHAGLPWLNLGALSGYVGGCAAVGVAVFPA